MKIFKRVRVDQVIHTYVTRQNKLSTVSPLLASMMLDVLTRRIRIRCQAPSQQGRDRRNALIYRRDDTRYAVTVLPATGFQWQR